MNETERVLGDPWLRRIRTVDHHNHIVKSGEFVAPPIIYEIGSSNLREFAVGKGFKAIPKRSPI